MSGGVLGRNGYDRGAYRFAINQGWVNNVTAVWEPALYDSLRANAYLARLEIAAGETEQGLARARALVETWKNADRAIPEVALAKQLIEQSTVRTK